MKKKIAGLLFIIGLGLGIAGLVKQTNDNEIFEIGNLEIKRDRDKNVNWMMIAGATFVVSSIIVVAVPAKK